MRARLIALAVLDGAMLVSCMAGMIPAGWALALHAALTALGYAVWLRGGATIGIGPAVPGVLGPAALLLALAIDRPWGRRAGDAMPFDEAPRPAAQSGATLAVARMLDGRVHHAGPETLGSFVTILRHGDVAARRRALETVVRSFEPALSPLIAQALTDGDQTIRALAAAASARVAQNLALARAGTMEEEGEGAELAALLADHARADVLLSDSQRGHLREDAIALTAPGDPAHAALQIEAAWAAGDYAAIDRLVETGEGPPGSAADWWRGQAAA